MSRYDSNPFEEEEVNPFAVSSTPINTLFLYSSMLVGFEICGIGIVLAYGFVGFCCFVFDLDFVVRSVSGISFPRRIRVRQSIAMWFTYPFFTCIFLIYKLIFCLVAVKFEEMWRIQISGSQELLSYIFDFISQSQSHLLRWSIIGIWLLLLLFSFLFLEWFHLLKRVRF